MDVKDHDGVTALMNAAESGSLEAVEALLKKGADAGAMSTTAFTPLIVAAAGGHLDVVKVTYRRSHETSHLHKIPPPPPSKEFDDATPLCYTVRCMRYLTFVKKNYKIPHPCAI